MPTRAVILKLVVPRSEGADATLTRRALWRTHQEINAATAHYERSLILLRGRRYQTADTVVDEATAQNAAIAHARSAQKANGGGGGGTDVEIIALLGRLYAAIVPSVLGV